jgi:hypothetical protein
MNEDCPSKDEIEEVVRQDPVLAGMKIVFGNQDRIKELRPWVNEVMKALHTAAYLTDQSCIGDFKPLFDTGFVTLDGVIADLGVPVAMDDLVVDVAARLRAKVRGQP